MLSKIPSRLNWAECWRMWGGQDSLLLIQNFSQAHTELRYLEPCLHSWSPTNNLTAMLKAVVLPFSYPIPYILFLFMQQEFGEIPPSAAPWVIHPTQERSKENKHLWMEEGLSSSLELLLHELRQVQLHLWMPKITFRKTQLKTQEKWVWITDIPREPDGNIPVT